MSGAVAILLAEAPQPLRPPSHDALAEAGLSVSIANRSADLPKLLNATSPAALILDLALSSTGGRAEMDMARLHDPDLPVIVLGRRDMAEEVIDALRGGACDGLLQPVDEARLVDAVLNALARRTPVGAGSGLTGTSQAMRDLRARLTAAAATTAPVFLTGESGTGKRRAAEEIHALSARRGGPFLHLTCGDLDRERLDAAILGSAGDVDEAQGGTLFLDEVSELAPDLQARLLGHLKSSGRLLGGDTRPTRGLRLVSAVRCDPQKVLDDGRLRQDLYYRLHVLPIRLPALRECGHDLLEIADQALGRAATEEGKRFEEFDAEARSALLAHNWPGNVRELLNLVRQIVILSPGGRITRSMLPMSLTAGDVPAGQAGESPSSQPGSILQPLLGLPLAEIERRAIEAAIAAESGSVTRAARTLDVAPSTLYRKIAAWQANSA
jgi:DNA-binding NtrC family response regulator